MAVTINPLGLSGALRVIIDTDVDNTLEANVNDGAATVYAIELDNTANGAASYFKAYNAATAVIGTTDPDLVLMVLASVTRTFVFPGGLAFGTGLSYGGVTVGGTTGTTSPTNNMIARIVVA